MPYVSETFACVAAVPEYADDHLTFEMEGNYVWLTNNRPKSKRAIGVALNREQARRLAKLLNDFAAQGENV